MRILGYIPARGGSKGVPGKNKKILGGLPLINYTIKAATLSQKLTDIYVSTDDLEIAEIVTSQGIAVPRLRPEELAQDTTPIVPVIQNDLAFLEQHAPAYDYIVILQPTNPFRSATLIDDCIDKMIANDADTLFTTVAVPQKFNPHWVFEYDATDNLRLATFDEQIIPRRQMLPPAFIRDGSVYIIKRKILEQGTLYGKKIAGFELQEEEIVNIDTPADWQNAEQKLAHFLSLHPIYKS